MKRLGPIVLCLSLLTALGAPLLRAQWKTEKYTLKPGYNGIYLHGDASYTTPAELFKNYPTVDEVWRWNPNPDQIQFSSSPATADPTSSEWTIWKRDPAANETQLTKMLGQSAYLIHVAEDSGAAVEVSIRQKPQPPSATWLITGANFLGFPADTSSATTTFANYFASFPVAINPPAKVYKYVGGPLGAANPIEVASVGNEKVDRNAAYWFQAATVGNFTGLVEYELPSNAGLTFGRTAASLTLGVMNRSNVAVTLTVTNEKSEDAPAGQTGITDLVPLTRRVMDTTSGVYTETPLVGSFSVTIPANGRMDLEFGIDRTLLKDPTTGLPAGASSLFASLLRIKDSARFTDVYLPVTAQPATPAGLWIGEVNVTAVDSSVAGSPGSTVARPFPLRLLIHVDASGQATVLSQAFVGNLAATGHAPGVCTAESLLWTDTKKDALRIVSSQMPLDQVIPAAGAFAVGSTLTYTIDLSYKDKTNPFVHIYHPDHDNLDARFKPLDAGVESYTVTRKVTLTFTAAPPDGSTISGWGTTVFGGTYAETIEGLGGIEVQGGDSTTRRVLSVRGGFGMRRVSEVAELTTPTTTN